MKPRGGADAGDALAGLDAVAVIAGGHASEHAISRWTGAALARTAHAMGLTVHPLLVSEGGAFALGEGLAADRDFPAEPWSGVERDAQGACALSSLQELRARGVSVVLNGLHGQGGEDGGIQGAFETLGFAHTGSGVAASALARDKDRSRVILAAAGLPVLPGRAWGAEEHSEAQLQRASTETGFPAVVKALGLGSSRGVWPVASLAEAREAVGRVLAETGSVLLERAALGEECTAPVVEDPAPRALPTVLIKPKASGWFDYESKYADGGADELCPAPFSAEREAELRRLALAAHRALGCEGVSRTDFIVEAQGAIWILEVNTLPGMTEASLVPKSAAVDGMGLVGVVRALLAGALARQKRGAGSFGLELHRP